MADLSAPIASIPDNTELPENVHALADEWRTADQRVKTIRKDTADAIAHLPQAQLDDAAALSAAVLANKPLPPNREHEDATRARIEDGGRRLPIAEAERDQIARRLILALRDDDARAHLVDVTANKVRPALEAYLTALRKAEGMVQEAHQALTRTTATMATIDALDTGAQVRVAPRAPGGLPSFLAAREAATRLAHQVDALTERKTPPMRHIQLTDGRNVTVPRELAADMLRDGIVTDWLDGWPAEEPSRPAVAGMSNFTGAPTRFVRRGDRDDAA